MAEYNEGCKPVNNHSNSFKILRHIFNLFKTYVQSLKLKLYRTVGETQNRKSV